MFVIILVLVLAAAAVHVARTGDWRRRHVGEVALVYLLVGYCGIPMVVVSGGTLLAPDRVAAVLGFPPGNPFQAFMGWSYLGMSLVAVLSLRYRGSYLVGPAILWAVYFAGATVVHLNDLGGRGALTHDGMLVILAVHGLVSLLLVAALLASGVWRRGAAPTGSSGASEATELRYGAVSVPRS